MWPFDSKPSENPFTHNVPRLGPEPLGDPKDVKISELEQRLFYVECAIIDICTTIKEHQELCNYNFMMTSKNFTNLANYVMTPRSSITGEQSETN